jgi:hypothetical protein
MADHAFDVGILAEHSRKPDWGPGKVVRVRPPYVWVFFRDAPGREARQFPGSLLERSSNQTDMVLDNLPPFIERDGVHLLPSERYTLQEALDIFHARGPEGFAGQGTNKPQKDRERRRLARAEYVRTMGAGQAEELLAQEDVAELGHRLLATVAAARTLSNADTVALRAGLQDEDAARAYFAALLAFLTGEPVEASFAAYVSAAARIAEAGGAAAASWPLVTLVPFLAQPERHLLLQPSVTCAAALRLGFDLPYRPTPNWLTYDALCRLGRIYVAALANAGARDLDDVHFFLATLVLKTPATAPASPAVA